MGGRLLDRYQERIRCFSKAGQNEQARLQDGKILTVVLGALVTLLASLSSAYFVRGTMARNRF